MKKIICTLILLTSTLVVKSQNLIGSSVRDVLKTLDTKGFIINQGYTEDRIYYVIGSDKESVRIYYFSNKNVCQMYALSYSDYTLTDIKNGLLAAGYRESSSGKFYDSEYEANIIWFNDYQCYFVVITPRID